MRSRKAPSRAALRRLAALAAGLLVLGPASAQGPPRVPVVPDASLDGLVGAPDWLVPVLRVLSPDRVVPAAGIAIAAERVLVPTEFVVDAASLVVLDGGADLARHGRSASVLQRIPRHGLAVLAVPGLDRAPPTLGASPTDGEVIELFALPPADLILQGEALVRRRAEVERDGPRRATVDAVAPLPNLTGALVNACGQWVGFSAARGVASLATGVNTLYLWQPDLASQLRAVGAELATAPCDRRLALYPSPVGDDGPTSGVAVAPGPGAAEGAAEEGAAREVPAEDGRNEPAPAAAPLVELDQPEILPAPGLPTAPAPSASTAPDESVGGPSVDDPPLWPWVLLTLVGGMALGWTARNLVAGRSVASPDPGNDATSDAAGVLAGTAAAGLAPIHAERAVYRLVADGERHPVPGRPGADGMTVDCLLGRFDADVLLADPSISRHHARLRGAPGRLAIHDLDTTNGTAVNGQDCPPGVGVPVEPGDRIRLGRRSYVLEATES